MSTSVSTPPTTTVKTIGKPLRVLAWLSFIFEVVIIGTGGAVRLTASGLGCSEWPLCTPDSLVPTPEQGLHGIIEFGNRTLTGVVLGLALAVVLVTLYVVAGRALMMRTVWWATSAVGVAVLIAVIEMALGGTGATFFAAGVVLMEIIALVDALRRTQQRRDLIVLSFIVLIGVTTQAFVGGLSVLTSLNPIIVGFHYLASLALVCVTAAYLVRMYAVPGPRVLAVPTWYMILTHVTTLFVAVTVVFGVLTTGAGPHSGDDEVLLRNGFDASLLEHVHAWPGYITFALTVILVAAAAQLGLPTMRWALALLVVELVQIAVGLYQARNGLPPFAVGVHMVLATLLAASMVVVVLRLKRPAVES